MAELPMGEFWQARPFIFTNIKGKGGEKKRRGF
jgi:hypothetical protein